MLIFMIGYMGSGKTTVGKELAQTLGYHFMDMDDLLEKALGMPIDEFFDIHGEQVFRFAEQELLKALTREKDTVVATGGGTPCHHQNMALMKKAGKTVYLEAGVKELHARLQEGSEQRPILKEVPVDALMGFIADHLEERKSFYSQAEMIINIEGKGERELAQAIATGLKTAGARS